MSITMGKNAVIRRTAAVDGLIAPIVEMTWLPGSTTKVQIPPLDEMLVKEKTYHIAIEDTLIKNNLWLYPMTSNFSLVDVSNPAKPFTIINKSKQFGTPVTIPDFHRFSLLLQNKEGVGVYAKASVWYRPNVYFPNIRPGCHFSI